VSHFARGERSQWHQFHADISSASNDLTIHKRTQIYHHAALPQEHLGKLSCHSPDLFDEREVPAKSQQQDLSRSPRDPKGEDVLQALFRARGAAPLAHLRVNAGLYIALSWHKFMRVI
jgi:hypothetical protein